jgi:hypothetical protein
MEGLSRPTGTTDALNGNGTGRVSGNRLERVGRAQTPDSLTCAAHSRMLGRFAHVSRLKFTGPEKIYMQMMKFGWALD